MAAEVGGDGEEEEKGREKITRVLGEKGNDK